MMNNKQYNPLIDYYNLGGFLSIGGSTTKGALQGATSLSMLGPVGMGIGAIGGGLMSFLQSKQQQKAQEETQFQQQNQISRNTLANMQYGIANSSNLPMAYGGSLDPIGQIPVGDFSNFETGGTHESNPLGGIPQGYNSNGQLRTVEEKESSFKFSDGKYIFSNRLNFE